MALRSRCTIVALAWCSSVATLPGAAQAEEPATGARAVAQADAEGSARAARLSLECNVLDVEVSLDGAKVAQSPLPGPIVSTAGAHELTLWRAGYRPIVRRVTLREGDNRTPCVLTVKRPHDDLVMTDLSVLTNPPGAVVFVDGQRFSGGLLPRGRHSMRVQKAGYETWERVITIDGPNYNEDVDLVPRERLAVVAPAEEPADESSAISDRTWSYLVGGAGIAVGAAATGIFFWNAQRYGSWEDEQQALDQAWTAGPPFSPELDERQQNNDALLNDVETMDAIWAVTATTSFALLGVGAYLFFTADDELEPRTLTATIHPNGGSVMWSTTW